VWPGFTVKFRLLLVTPELTRVTGYVPGAISGTLTTTCRQQLEFAGQPEMTGAACRASVLPTYAAASARACIIATDKTRGKVGRYAKSTAWRLRSAREQ
jgi:hypothetical protein